MEIKFNTRPEVAFCDLHTGDMFSWEPEGGVVVHGIKIIPATLSNGDEINALDLFDNEVMHLNPYERVTPRCATIWVDE
jgi:hypothetical protein